MKRPALPRPVDTETVYTCTHLRNTDSEPGWYVLADWRMAVTVLTVAGAVRRTDLSFVTVPSWNP